MLKDFKRERRALFSPSIASAAVAMMHQVLGMASPDYPVTSTGAHEDGHHDVDDSLGILSIRSDLD